MTRVALRKHLFVLAIASILPIALLAGAGLLTLFQQQRAEAERKALEITRALATAVDAELQRSISALLALASATSLDRGDIAAFDGTARRALAVQPQWLSINLATPAGEALINTRFTLGEPLPAVVETECLKAAVRTAKPQVGSLSQARGRNAVALRVPVVKDGAVRYVLTGVVDPASILAIVARQRVPDDWVISVFDSKGIRVARSRNHAQYLGTQPAESLQALMAGNADEGTGTTRTLEGDTVFTAYTRLERGRWVVAMGLPASGVFLGAARSIAAYASMVTLSIVIGLAWAFVLARRINGPMAQLRDAANALGEGREDPVPQTGIREIHEVGAAIADAARRRAASEAEREELLQREQAARAEAEAASRAKDNFLAMLGHELRNPLAALSNAANLLGVGASHPAIAGRAQEVIQRQVAHLARLTDDLLDAARALLGKIELRAEPIDLAAVATQALATLTATGRTGRHRLNVDLGAAWIDGDAVRCDQIVSNLLVNAVKYTPDGGAITVRTHRDGDECVLTVADDGVGMSPELAARAFGLFVQGERGLDRAQGGLGIGLTLVRRLAELHGGRADVASDGENRGCKFTVRFPAIDAPAAAAAGPAQAARENPCTVLVIEDNDDARETLQMLLHTMGHHVHVAPDGLSGLEKMLEVAPDVALVDLGLPGLDGLQLARRVRASGGSEIYLVAVTGYGAREDRTRALEAGFDAHMTKPVGAAELHEILRRSRT